MLFTSNYAKSFSNPRAVAISRGTPKGFTGRKCEKLAPLWFMIKDCKLSESEWKEKYFETILSKLNPNQIAKELGEGAVMLCWEGEDKPCHRHYVAEWLRNAGIQCEEIKKEEGFPEKKEEVDTRKAKEEFKGFNQAQVKIARRYEILKTFPENHSQTRKISEQIKNLFLKLKEKEKEPLKKMFEYAFEMDAN